jgi:arylsulfatase I/J
MDLPVVLIALSSLVLVAAAPPHIVMILVDDYGHANIGYHHNSTEVLTPNLDGLAAKGIILERHYAFKFCSPSRSSLQSGRLPVHVNVENAEPEIFNPKDVVSGFQGIPRNMTCIATKLKGAGYNTVMTGKW